MDTIKKLIISLKNENGSTHNITLTDIKDNLTREDVERVANKLISDNIIYTNNGDLTSFEEAKIVTTTTEIL